MMEEDDTVHVRQSRFNQIYIMKIPQVHVSGL